MTRFVITIESEKKMPIEQWKKLRSRADFVLACHFPDAHTFIDVKDTICPRQKKDDRSVHDLI